ncbi:MAG: ROK family protein, partial [bacterium]|nr:ROK family protein [bacterium]
TGAKGGGAELGHYCIDPNGPPCNCGSNGCLEVYTGRDGIIRRGAEKHPGRANWTPLDWSNAADKGDFDALQLWHETGVYLGLALTAYVNIFHPERIILAGGIAQAGEKLFQPIRETVFHRAFRGLADGLTIVPAAIGEWAGAVGAAILAEREHKTVVTRN